MPLVKSKQETKKCEVKPISKQLIGTLGEKSLHSALKEWYRKPVDRLEEMVEFAENYSSKSKPPIFLP